MNPSMTLPVRERCLSRRWHTCLARLNEVKSEVEGVIRAIHVGNAEPVEFGQLLFELEPVGAPPLDAL